MNRFKNTWCGAHCDTEADKKRARSWFSPLADDCDVLKIDVLDDPETCRTTKIRILARLPDGRLEEMVRTFGGKTYTLTCKPPSRAILRGFKVPLPNVIEAQTGGDGR